MKYTVNHILFTSSPRCCVSPPAAHQVQTIYPHRNASPARQNPYTIPRPHDTPLCGADPSSQQHAYTHTSVNDTDADAERDILIPYTSPSDDQPKNDGNGHDLSGSCWHCSAGLLCAPLARFSSGVRWCVVDGRAASLNARTAECRIEKHGFAGWRNGGCMWIWGGI